MHTIHHYPLDITLLLIRFTLGAGCHLKRKGMSVCRNIPIILYCTYHGSSRQLPAQVWLAMERSRVLIVAVEIQGGGMSSDVQVHQHEHFTNYEDLHMPHHPKKNFALIHSRSAICILNFDGARRTVATLLATCKGRNTYIFCLPPLLCGALWVTKGPSSSRSRREGPKDW